MRGRHGLIERPPASVIPAVDPREDEQALTQDLNYEQILVGQGVRRRGSRLVRKVRAPFDGVEIERDGQKYMSYRMVEREVSLTLEQAQETETDYYHPGGTLNSTPDVPAGWYRWGRKREIDYPQHLGAEASPWLEELVPVADGEEQTDAV